MEQHEQKPIDDKRSGPFRPPREVQSGLYRIQAQNNEIGDQKIKVWVSKALISHMKKFRCCHGLCLRNITLPWEKKKKMDYSGRRLQERLFIRRFIEIICTRNFGGLYYRNNNEDVNKWLYLKNIGVRIDKN